MDQQAMELLAKISQIQTEMRNEILMLRNETTILRADQGTIVHNVAKIENDFTMFRADQGTIVHNVAKIENDVTMLRADQETIAQNVAKMENDITILRTDQVTIAQNVAKIEMVLEHKAAQKISALFDFREIQMDHNQKIVKVLERIEAKIEDLQLETSNLKRIK
jgi:hypothetical protein